MTVLFTKLVLAFALLSLVCAGLIGCTSDYQLNPNQVARWERTPATMPILGDAAMTGAAAPPAEAARDTVESNASADEPRSIETVLQAQRKVVYTGWLTVLSPDPDGAIDAARNIAEQAGGYVTSLRRQQVVLRVPAYQFEPTVEALSELGLVTDRQINAADVTAELLDLDIRLDNLEALRVRMKALLEKTEKVEDALKIETELARLTTEVEQIKGQLRLLRNRVALSTITVAFNSPTGTASGLATRVRPFPWVNAVGAEAFGVSPLPNAQAKLGKGAKLDLPAGFVRFYQQAHRVYAIDRSQVVLKVTRHANYDQADAAFWIDQVRDRLTQDLGVPVDPADQLTIRGDETGYTLAGKRPAGEDHLGYFVGLAASDDFVYLVEGWGPAEALYAKHRDLIQSLKTLRVDNKWW